MSIPSKKYLFTVYTIGNYVQYFIPTYYKYESISCSIFKLLSTKIYSLNQRSTQ